MPRGEARPAIVGDRRRSSSSRSPARRRSACVVAALIFDRALRPGLGRASARASGSSRSAVLAARDRSTRIYQPNLFDVLVFGNVPERRHGRDDDDLHHDGPRPEHRRRLRGPARPRLRRVLRDGRVHGRVVRVAAVLERRTCTSAASASAPNTPGFHISIWLVLIIAGVFAAIAGILIGLPTLRLRGDYLAIVTLGFGEILPQIARNGDNLFGASTSRTARRGSTRSTRPASATRCTTPSACPRTT